MSPQSIYKSPQGEAAIMDLYEQALKLLGIEYQDRMVGTRFGATHILIAGPEDGQPLVVFHGGNSINPLLLAWFVPLTKDYRVYAPDTIGHPGRSAQTRLSPRDNSYGEWTVDLLDAFGFEQAMLIGPSYGAGIILRTAAVAPQRINKAVLLVPSGIISPPIMPMIFGIVVPMILHRLFPSQKRLVRAARPLFTEGEKIDDLWLQSISLAFLQVKIETRMPRPATKQELANFQAPTLVLAAEKDILFPGEAVIARAKEIIPNLVAAELLEGSGHVQPKRLVEPVNNRIRIFLTETR